MNCMKSLVCSGVVAAMLLGGGIAGPVSAAEAQNAEKKTVVTEVDKKAEKSAIAKMRGKLLYKKGQVRKLEKAAAAADPILAEKLADLETQRRTLLKKAEPKLETLYVEQDALEEEVKKMSGK